MDRSPRISIIVPAYNVGNFITTTLQSVIDQTASDWRCIVVDDGSTDDTADKVREIAAADDRIVLICQSNGGASRARNTAIQKIDPACQYVCFLDSDDVWVPTALETLRQAIENHPETIGAHGLGDLIDASGKRLDAEADFPDDTFADFGRSRMIARDGQLSPVDVSAPTTFAVLYPVSRLYPTGLAMIRRSALAKAGPFDTTFNSLEDWDMWLRLTRQGPLWFVNQTVIHYRRHGQNLTNNSECTSRNVRRLLSKHYFSRENSPEQQRIVTEGFRAFHALRRDENRRLARESWVSGNYGGFMRALLKTCHHSIVKARGFPTPLGI